MSNIDVIILSWDRMDDTIAAIDSALAQKDVEHHVIVVDQGSKPEGLKQLEAHCAGNAMITLIKNTENNGVPGGRNQASYAGNGSIIVALDNDAVFRDENQLRITADIMEAEPTIGALAFRILRYGAHADEQPDDRSSWPYSEQVEAFADQRFNTVRFVGAGHAIRRDAFEMIGGYDDRLFFLHEEVDLSKRLINAGYDIVYDPRVAVEHKVSAEHRVSWNGQRYFYDVRNKTYLHIKLRTALPTMLFHTALMVWRGIKSGYAAGSLKGLWAAIMMIPDAVSERRSNRYTKMTPESEAYFEACSPTSGMSAWQRIKMRLGDANRKVGA